MKDLDERKLCLGLQIERLTYDIFVQQFTYIEHFLKDFIWIKHISIEQYSNANSFTSCERDDIFKLQDDNEELLSPKVSYLNPIVVLMYLVNNSRPDIGFSLNLLAKFSSSPTKRRHWNEMKHTLRYHQ